MWCIVDNTTMYVTYLQKDFRFENKTAALNIVEQNLKKKERKKERKRKEK